MANSGPAIELVLRHEGGYVNDPLDPGGETNFGISKRSYPALDIKGLSRDGAVEIYKRDFWCFDAIPDQALANCVLDASVNQGHATAIKMLQKISGVAQDGVWGPATAQASNRANLREFQITRLLRYVSTVAQNPALLKDLGGWFRRTLDC